MQTPPGQMLPAVLPAMGSAVAATAAPLPTGAALRWPPAAEAAAGEEVEAAAAAAAALAAAETEPWSAEALSELGQALLLGEVQQEQQAQQEQVQPGEQGEQEQGGE